ncbi:MAG: hypothetical protein HC921_09875 [Synechococcaceae cyanobacterium SM2_3_1]|nr:hypothetical protein [Synechococcaceae cyanobacterium SM2_3_1]
MVLKLILDDLRHDWVIPVDLERLLEKLLQDPSLTESDWQRLDQLVEEMIRVTEYG